MYHIELDHSLDAAHRVYGHEGGKGKCARLHGHTYRFHVEVDTTVLDETGFVVDFGVIKRALDVWDHRTLLWEDDPLAAKLRAAETSIGLYEIGLVELPCNPTSENMSRIAAQQIGADLPDGSVVLVVASETPRSSSRWRHTVHHGTPNPTHNYAFPAVR
jgi:6-pyruvoyl tetrahydropterin synthase/QueD family protein